MQDASGYDAKLRAYIADHGVDAEHHIFTMSCHSVAEAVEAINTETQWTAAPEDFVKNICLVNDSDADGDGAFIVAIVKGEDAVSMKRVAKALELAQRPRLATPEEVVALTGYGFGGTPSFGFAATWLVDPRVLEVDVVWTGGGTAQSLTRIGTEALLRANGGTVARIRK